MAAPERVAAGLRTRDEGTGPVVVLLHGVGGDHLVWNEVIPLLAREFRVLAPDFRGHGRSPSPPGSTFRLEEFVGDVLQLLDERSIPAAHWVGFSGGGFVALRLTLEHPARTRSLALVSSAAYLDNHSRAVLQRWWDTSAEEGRDALALRLLKDLFYPDWIERHEAVIDLVHEEVAHREYGPAVAWAKSLVGFDERNRISSIRVPTLIVQAMDDQVTDPSHGRILRQSIPDSAIRIFAETGHLVPMERPEELATAIAEHVRKAEAASPAR